MRYLITGTAGFIGFHLARRLLDEGHFVVGFDGMTPYYDVRLKEKRTAILARSNGFKAVTGMLEDKAALDHAAELAEPDVIVHLAAQAGVRYSLENPRSYVDSNLVGSFNILELARNLQPKHLLLASTSSVYGANEKIPFAESDKADEQMTIYAATKKSMELMAHSYAHLFRVPTTAFRFFTVYGPWGRPDMALFKFVDAIKNDRPIEIYGEGKMSRDFTYIDDLVEGIVRLIGVVPSEENRVVSDAVIDTLSKNAPFRVVNIGGGQPVGLMSFVETIETMLGKKAIRKMLPMQPGDVHNTYAVPDLLIALTGFKPQIEVEEGVRRFVEWYQENY
ncbi:MULTISPECIES: NAD-dependent epimerase [unclassified Rhizobium]|uniref:NAD-dependent epimerase n=1 Tax=unclassified Rhizobium TaxID=2613769 RepID=UPI00161596EC|nr:MULTISPECIES: NAD-dependent epimerase [unclassified Rhizobium]MBB3287943.1 UDP-glucuronate 4-epimerase [Rhizobium sp. BK252]MBB3402453.1 UDP-glucuronate 4-epimerase [Rhizobium sp. BK289]MBB3415029.1 UDP-glucuronate 4-epimerase [Rhizobium sp. BK284]MBB3482918.1 UDP-glucuronate 4-epimerase [Rhizobium sp. BK347]MDK4720543.1 NAD-dependent epimerase [Rhizobium sp. CNPSo 3968]